MRKTVFDSEASSSQISDPENQIFSHLFINLFYYIRSVINCYRG